MGQFVHIIGKRLHLRSGQALFVFVGNVLPPTGSETFISCIDSYVSSGCLGKVLTVMMCCIYHGPICCRKLVHSDPRAYLKVDIRVKKEKMVVKVKSKTCANGLQHLYWQAYTTSTRIMMGSCISVTVGRKHLAKKDDFILLYLYIGSK